MPTVIFPSSEDLALLARAVNKAEPLEPRRSHSLIRRPGKQGGACSIRGEAGVALQSSSPPGQARRGRTTRTPGAERLYAAIVRGRCCRLLIALALLLILARADAAEPSLTDYFRAWGIGDDAFAKFSDDRQVTDDELGVIRRIAVRLRDCPPDRLQPTMPQAASSVAEKLPSPSEAKGRTPGHRMFAIEGLLGAVERVQDATGEPLWRCVVTLDRSPGSPASPGVSSSPARL